MTVRAQPSLPIGTSAPQAVKAPLVSVRRGPRIARSAVFGSLFLAAIFLTIFGTLLSYSTDAANVEQAWDLLRLNLIIILVLGIYLGHRIWTNVFAPLRGQVAPLLHRRFVLIFSLAALLPAILVGVLSTSLLTQNLSSLFGQNVQENMEEARQILDGYVAQELSELGADVTELREAIDLDSNQIGARISFNADLRRFARVRELDAVYLFQEDGLVLSRVESLDVPPLRVPSLPALATLEANEIVFQKQVDENYLVAITKLPGAATAYLYVGQLLRSDNQVLSSISGIESATGQIRQFNARQTRMKQVFLLSFVDGALLILMAAIWLGLGLANRIIDPLSGLVNAAERVRDGDMSARVEVSGDWGEISDLGSAFNRMTSQLEGQRDALVLEHEVSEQRRQFSEAVLSGVSAGVIGLTQNGKITLLNDAAKRLLEDRGGGIVDQPIAESLAEFAPIFAKAREAITGTARDQVTIEMKGGGSRIFDLHISAYQGARSDMGWVLTFDDMTRLVSAQRHSAWREVARRIAHEIKNPLTPIQLSAERLSRKYAKEITSDRETFDKCTQTIIRQVGSLEQMVDEFSAFARMPTPEFSQVDLIALSNEMVFAHGVSFPDIKFKRRGRWSGKLMVRADERLLSQALTNLLKNAGEAVQRQIERGTPGFKGRVEVEMVRDTDWVEIRITDNGPGWPSKDIERLMEPYVTTRDTGTGLGLAIVKRIVEDHEGRLVLQQKEVGTGAQATIILPYDSTVQKRRVKAQVKAKPSLTGTGDLS